MEVTAAERAADEAERQAGQERLAEDQAERVEASVEESYVDRPESEFRRQHAEQFLEPMNRVGEKVEPHTAPEYLVERVNPDYSTGEPYQSNCADSARCFERAWRGNVEEAAGRAYQINTEHDPDLPGLYVNGEPTAMTETWAGREMHGVLEPRDLEEELQREGPGASAIVHTRWLDESGHAQGHAYNVVNDHGTIKVVDTQTHEVLPFDHESVRPGIPPTSRHEVLIWDAEGRPVG
jgi:hypothetical protein